MAAIAYELGIPRSEFLSWSTDDQAEAMEYRRERNLMAAYDSQRAEEEAARQASKTRRK